MEENSSITDMFEDLLAQLFALNYRQSDEIVKVEQKIYAVLQQNPGRIEGLITLMQAQIMLANRAKAVALAHRIWEIGGNLSEYFELVLINNLLNLGLLDMAAILIKPRFENLAQNAEYFYPVLSKFAVMTGNFALMARLSPYVQAAEGDVALYQFAAFYQYENRNEAFKNVQKLIIENIGESLLSYEYNFYSEEEFPDLEIVLYVDADRDQRTNMEELIDVKITAFYRSIGLERFDNHYVSLEDIHNHPAYAEEEDDASDSDTATPSETPLMDEQALASEAAAWGQKPRS